MTPAVESWISLAIQIPLVGLFIWFSLRLVSAFLTSNETITKNFVESMDRRDQAWREFIREQREANNAAIQNMASRFSDEIRALGKEVAAMRGRQE